MKRNLFELSDKEKNQILEMHKKEIGFEKTKTTFLKENTTFNQKKDVDYMFKKLLDEQRSLDRKATNFLFEQEQTKLPQTYEEFEKLETSPQVKSIPTFSEFWKRLYELKNKGNKRSRINAKTYEQSIRNWLGYFTKEATSLNTKILDNFNAMLKIATEVRNDPKKINSYVGETRGEYHFYGFPSTDGTKESAVDDHIAALSQIVQKIKTMNDNKIYLSHPSSIPSNIKGYWEYLTTNKLDPAKPSILMHGWALKYFLPLLDGVDPKTKKEYFYKKSFAKITDEQKIELLNNIQQKADNTKKLLEKRKKRGREIKNANFLAVYHGGAIDFTKETTASEEIKQEEVATQPVDIETPYPSKSMNDPAVRDFFKDDQLIISSEQKTGFQNALSEAISAAQQIGTIIEVGYAAGSSTSKVRTAYKSTEYSPKNNETLVDDRLKEIERVMSEIIDANEALKGVPKVFRKDKRERYPNNPMSPEWGDAERKKYPLIKRQKMVDGKPNPKFDQRVADEYDRIYGPYRGSFGSFYLKVQPNPEVMSETVTFEEVSYTAGANYTIQAGWWELPEFETKTKPKKDRRGSSGGGGGYSSGPRAGGHDCCFCGGK